MTTDIGLKTEKKALDSKGILGGLLGVSALSILSILLRMGLGVEISADEIGAVRDDVGSIVMESHRFYELAAPVTIALVTLIGGLIGNWRRKAVITWRAARGTKRPWQSWGVVGAFLSMVSAGWAVVSMLFSGVPLDAASAIEDVQWLVLTTQDFIAVVAPLVIAVGSSLLSWYGRWRAKSQVVSL